MLSDCTARIYEIAGEGKISKSIALGDLGIYISPYPVSLQMNFRYLIFRICLPKSLNIHESIILLRVHLLKLFRRRNQGRSKILPDERYDPPIYRIQLGWSWKSKTIKYLKSIFLNHFLWEEWEGPLLFLERKIARQVCFSRSSSKILLALDSCEVKVVDSRTGDVICRCKGGKHHITSASFSPVPWLPLHRTVNISSIATCCDFFS